jgi:transcriptional regulator with XRE-family HTH domain
MEREFRLNWTLLVEEAVRRRRNLKLTQKTLAGLAEVSTPTVSRFEQNDADIQLSSVLKILGVLGMTDQRNLLFADDKDHRYDFGIGVIFWGQEGKKRIKCVISREALDDHFSDGDKLRSEAAFAKYKSQIQALARRKYLLGQLEPDGSVLIRTLEINS